MRARVSIAQQIACVARELGLRYVVYPRQVAAGRMKQGMADREIEHMEAVLGTLKDLDAGEAGEPDDAG